MFLTKLINYILLLISVFSLNGLYAKSNNVVDERISKTKIEGVSNKNLSIDSSITLLKIKKEKTEKSNNCEDYLKTVADLGRLYILKSDPIEVIKLTEELFSSPLKCHITKPEIYLNCANSYSQLGDFKRTLVLIDSAIAITRNDTTDLIRVYFQAGFIWSEFPKSLQSIGYKNALEYFSKAEKLLDNQKNTKNYVIFLNDEADIYLRMKLWNKSLEKLKMAKNICIKNKFVFELKACLLTEAEVYYSIQNYSRCLKTIEEIQKIKLDIPFRAMTIDITILLAKTYNKLKEHKLALETLNSIDENELINQNIFPTLQDYYEVKSEIYGEINDFKKALYFYKKYKSIQDSIMNESTVLSIQYWEFKSKSSEKNKMLFEREKLIHQQEKLLSRKNQWILILVFFAVISLMAFIGFNLFQKQRKKQNQNYQKTELYKAISSTEQAERARIAKELHDSVAGMLTIAGMNLMEAKRNNFNNESQLDKIQLLINNSTVELRKSIHNLLPSSLDNNDLVNAVELYCSEINYSNNLIIDIETKGDFKKLDPLWSLSLYRIIQELLNNIIKHAKATHSLIILEINNNSLQMFIEDNGVGFILNNVMTQNHLGLKNVIDRVIKLGGTIHIDSQENIGTSIEIKFNVIV